MRAVHTWLAMSGLTGGPLLRRVDKADHLTGGATPMATSSVRRVLTRAAGRAGVDHPSAVPALAAARVRQLTAGVPEAEIARAGGGNRSR